MDYFKNFLTSRTYTYSYNKNWKSPEYTQYHKNVYSPIRN